MAVAENITILGIDPGIDIAGLTVLKKTGAACKLHSVSGIEADLSTTDARVRFLISEFRKEAGRYLQDGKVVVAIELPNEILYGVKGSIGQGNRASGVIKLIAAAYGVMGGLTGICPVFCVRPRDWQPSKKSRGIDDVKLWSRLTANQRLIQFKSSIKPFGKSEQDLADSLNIGLLGLSNILKEKWVL